MVFTSDGHSIELVGTVAQVDPKERLTTVRLLETSDRYVEFLDSLTLCRRSGERAPLGVAVVRSDDLEPGIYAAVNISDGGMCLRSARREPVNGFVALRFTLDGEELSVYGQIVWCRPDLAHKEMAGLHTLGVKFLAPSPEVVARIRAYVDRSSAEGTDR